MVDKSPVILTWLSISLGVIFVIAGIALVTLLSRMVNLGVSEVATSAVGAAVGVAVWFVWLSRRNKQDG